MSQFRFTLKAEQTIDTATASLESNLNARGIDHQVNPDPETPGTYVLTIADAEGTMASIRNKFRVSDTQTALRLIGNIVPVEAAVAPAHSQHTSAIKPASQTR
jgi:hypothetical protein